MGCRGVWSGDVEGDRGVVIWLCFCFFFQAEDGIRDAQESRGLGDVYKRQLPVHPLGKHFDADIAAADHAEQEDPAARVAVGDGLSLIHI